MFWNVQHCPIQTTWLDSLHILLGWCRFLSPFVLPPNSLSKPNRKENFIYPATTRFHHHGHLEKITTVDLVIHQLLFWYTQKMNITRSSPIMIHKNNPSPPTTIPTPTIVLLGHSCLPTIEITHLPTVVFLAKYLSSNKKTKNPNSQVS